MKEFDFEEIFDQVKDQSEVEYAPEDHEHSIVDIITFCEHRDYLSFSTLEPPFILSDMQKIILKTFYAGSMGNKHLKLSEKEKKLLLELQDKKEDKAKKLMIDNILERAANDLQKRELVLVIGRRAGKTMLSSIIACYEAYKLLEAPNGNPQAYYNITQDNPITILNVATASEQAGELFGEIKSRIRYGKYFRGKVSNITQEDICLLTDNDKRINSELKREGRENETINGTVRLRCGHSNSASLRGKGCIAVIFDELAFFNEGTQSQGGSGIYTALTPSTKTFKHPDGTMAGKVIAISSPAGKSGQFYRMYQDSFLNEYGVMFQFPSWEISPILEQEDLKDEFRKNYEKAQMEYGAEFTGSMSTNMFNDDDVDACINLNLVNKEKGLPYVRYYLHVDPALTNHNYALCLLHSGHYIDKENNNEAKRVVTVDHIKVWTPKDGKEVDINEVDKYVIDLCKKFKIVSVSYDAWNSASSIQKMRRKGIRAIRTPFRGHYKQTIYSELKDLFVDHAVEIPPDALLVGELKNLQIKMTQSGFKIFPDSDCEFPTDDYCDCLAGAAHVALENSINQLPEVTTVSTRPSGSLVTSIYNSDPTSTYVSK